MNFPSYVFWLLIQITAIELKETFSQLPTAWNGLLRHTKIYKKLHQVTSRYIIRKDFFSLKHRTYFNIWAKIKKTKNKTKQETKIEQLIKFLSYLVSALKMTQPRVIWQRISWETVRIMWPIFISIRESLDWWFTGRLAHCEDHWL